MKNLLTKLWNAITTPFTAIAVLIGESKEINEGGSWDKYWERRNSK